MQKLSARKSNAAGRRILKGANQILDYLRGDQTQAQTISIEKPDLRGLRAKLKLSQEQFAEVYGIPLRTVQSWEQGVRHPDATARAYLKTIERIPAQVRNALTR